MDGTVSMTCLHVSEGVKFAMPYNEARAMYTYAKTTYAYTKSHVARKEIDQMFKHVAGEHQFDMHYKSLGKLGNVSVNVKLKDDSAIGKLLTSVSCKMQTGTSVDDITTDEMVGRQYQIMFGVRTRVFILFVLTLLASLTLQSVHLEFKRDEFVGDVYNNDYGIVSVLYDHLVLEVDPRNSRVYASTFNLDPLSVNLLNRAIVNTVDQLDNQGWVDVNNADKDKDRIVLDDNTIGKILANKMTLEEVAVNLIRDGTSVLKYGSRLTDRQLETLKERNLQVLVKNSGGTEKEVGRLGTALSNRDDDINLSVVKAIGIDFSQTLRLMTQMFLSRTYQVSAETAVEFYKDNTDTFTAKQLENIERFGRVDVLKVLSFVNTLITDKTKTDTETIKSMAFHLLVAASIDKDMDVEEHATRYVKNIVQQSPLDIPKPVQQHMKQLLIDGMKDEELSQMSMKMFAVGGTLLLSVFARVFLAVNDYRLFRNDIDYGQHFDISMTECVFTLGAFIAIYYELANAVLVTDLNLGNERLVELNMVMPKVVAHHITMLALNSGANKKDGTVTRIFGMTGNHYALLHGVFAIAALSYGSSVSDTVKAAQFVNDKVPNGIIKLAGGSGGVIALFVQYKEKLKAFINKGGSEALVPVK